MNAGAGSINEAGIALVYLVNVVPSLTMKLTGPYWFHYVSYRCRINLMAFFMVLCLCIVAWGNSGHVKLLGVGFCSLAAGMGEASILAMTSFYDAQSCLAAWSSGTGFAGIAGYIWSLAFDAIDTCFQVQLMVALWIPVAWLLTFYGALIELTLRCEEERVTLDHVTEEEIEERCASSAKIRRDTTCHSASEVATSKLTVKERFFFILGLWPYTVPLLFVYVSEYAIQSGLWAAMGFPVTDPVSRRSWYKWSNFTYQVGVFISRTFFILICRSRSVLWSGGLLQILMAIFFTFAAVHPFGGWWLLAPSLFVGFLGGGVYVGAFSLIAKEQNSAYVELALCSASVADTIGMIFANILGLIAQGPATRRASVLDTKPDFTCGFDIWDNFNRTSHPPVYATHCFPGVQG
ncbi:Protein BTN1 [Durusdinium trenchii]|uniref:Protein BTN1 n=1 Tax=Durusdinium trenchii TaxID=1381693 RepID=A0ABP0J2Q6_9DINO